MTDSLDAVLSRVALETESSDRRIKYVREWALDKLDMVNEIDTILDQYIRIRIALSLCPVSAISHLSSERVSRFEKIEMHLLEFHDITGTEAATLARSIDSIITKWQTNRQSVSSFRQELFERDGVLCRSCHVNLENDVRDADSVSSRDGFKLNWGDPERSLQASVDHKIPVSKFGTNELENLQLLCRFCNSGKSDGSLILLKHEVETGVQLPYVSTGDQSLDGGLVQKSSALVYRTLRRDGYQCTVCASSSDELTIRKSIESGLAVLSNVSTICYRCIQRA